MEPEREVIATRRLLTILALKLTTMAHTDQQILKLQWRNNLLVPVFDL